MSGERERETGDGERQVGEKKDKTLVMALRPE